jgi:hypothetical protein
VTSALEVHAITVPKLVPDYSASRAADHAAAVRSLCRAAIVAACGIFDRNAAREAAKTWSGDREFLGLIKAPVPPTTLASGWPANGVLAYLAALRPVSAGADLLQRGLQLSFDGAAAVGMPGPSLRRSESGVTTTQARIRGWPGLNRYSRTTADPRNRTFDSLSGHRVIGTAAGNRRQDLSKLPSDIGGSR